MAAEYGEAVGLYAAGILDTPLPWTKTRQGSRLLGLMKSGDPIAVENRAGGRMGSAITGSHSSSMSALWCPRRRAGSIHL
jgi:hypothetical protein